MIMLNIPPTKILIWVNVCDWLVVFRHPCEQYLCSSLGMMTKPQYVEKHVPNHQPAIKYWLMVSILAAGRYVTVRFGYFLVPHEHSNIHLSVFRSISNHNCSITLSCPPSKSSFDDPLSQLVSEVALRERETAT